MPLAAQAKHNCTNTEVMLGRCN